MRKSKYPVFRRCQKVSRSSSLDSHLESQLAGLRLRKPIELHVGSHYSGKPTQSCEQIMTQRRFSFTVAVSWKSSQSPLQVPTPSRNHSLPFPTQHYGAGMLQATIPLGQEAPCHPVTELTLEERQGGRPSFLFRLL